MTIIRPYFFVCVNVRGDGPRRDAGAGRTQPNKRNPFARVHTYTCKLHFPAVEQGLVIPAS